MEVYNTKEARSSLFKLMKNTIDSYDPIFIVGKESKAVLISEDYYKSMVETICLKSMPGVESSILEGMNTPKEELIELNLDDL